jgi:hypothetical protein
VVVVVGAVVVDVGGLVVVDVGGELRVVVVGVTVVDVVGREVVVVVLGFGVVGPSTVGAVVAVGPAGVFVGVPALDSNRPASGESTDAAPVFAGGAGVVGFWEPGPSAVVGVSVAAAVLGVTLSVVEVDVAARCGDTVSLSMNPTYTSPIIVPSDATTSKVVNTRPASARRRLRDRRRLS